MKDKLDYSKMIKQGIFTPNTSKRRNLTITHNSSKKKFLRNLWYKSMSNTILLKFEFLHISYMQNKTA